jgi:hypothetical protein
MAAAEVQNKLELVYRAVLGAGPVGPVDLGVLRLPIKVLEVVMVMLVVLFPAQAAAVLAPKVLTQVALQRVGPAVRV